MIAETDFRKYTLLLLSGILIVVLIFVIIVIYLVFKINSLINNIQDDITKIQNRTDNLFSNIIIEAKQVLPSLFRI